MRFSYHRGTIFRISGLRLGCQNLNRKWYQKPSKMHPKMVPKPYQKCIQICIAKRKALHNQIWPTWSQNGTPKGTQKPNKSNPKGASRSAISGIQMQLRSGAVLDPKMWPKSSQDEALKVAKWAPKGCCRHALPKVMALSCYKQAVPLLPVNCWHCHASAVLVAAFRFSLSRFGLRGGGVVKKTGACKKHAFSSTLFEPIFAENGPKKLPFWSPYGLQKWTLIAPKSMYKPM